MASANTFSHFDCLKRTRQGWLYLAVLINLVSRSVVGWAAAEHMRDELTLMALNHAFTEPTSRHERKPSWPYLTMSKSTITVNVGIPTTNF